MPERVDVIVKDKGPDGTKGPFLAIQFPPSFYEAATVKQGEMFTHACELVFEEFWKHVAKVRAAGG